MTTDGPTHDTRQAFDEQLESIRQGTVEMGLLVLENARRIAQALHQNDLEVARRAVAADDEVDERYMALERQVFEIIARQQPVAGDLRFLIAITRLLYEIERSGDLVVNVANGLLRHEGYRLPADIQGTLVQISRRVVDLFAKAIEVFAELEGGGFKWLDRLDDDVDEAVGELYTRIAASSDELGFDVAVELSRSGRFLERIADHGVNIGEHVAFIVTGSFPEHHPESTAFEDEGPADEG